MDLIRATRYLLINRIQFNISMFGYLILDIIKVIVFDFILIFVFYIEFFYERVYSCFMILVGWICKYFMRSSALLEGLLREVIIKF